MAQDPWPLLVFFLSPKNRAMSDSDASPLGAEAASSDDELRAEGQKGPPVRHPRSKHVKTSSNLRYHVLLGDGTNTPNFNSLRKGFRM